MIKRFKWQIAQELREAGKAPFEIAESMGVKLSSAYLYLTYAKNRTSKNMPTQVIKSTNFVDGELKRGLIVEAQKRGLTMTCLADMILAHVIDSDLFTAVLDD